jgi:hypothetical protein
MLILLAVVQYLSFILAQLENIAYFSPSEILLIFLLLRSPHGDITEGCTGCDEEKTYSRVLQTSIQRLSRNSDLHEVNEKNLSNYNENAEV